MPLSAAPPTHPAAKPFGAHMTLDDVVAKIVRIERQEKPHCQGMSFDRNAANVFQGYVSGEMSA